MKELHAYTHFAYRQIKPSKTIDQWPCHTLNIQCLSSLSGRLHQTCCKRVVVGDVSWRLPIEIWKALDCDWGGVVFHVLLCDVIRMMLRPAERDLNVVGNNCLCIFRWFWGEDNGKWRGLFSWYNMILGVLDNAINLKMSWKME